MSEETNADREKLRQDRQDRHELDDIVAHSTAQAEALYPKRMGSWRVRIIMVIVGVLIVGNLVLNVIDTAILSRSTACQKQQGKTLTALRSSNQAATSVWINSVSDQIKAKKLTGPGIEELRQQYNRQLAKNNAEIDRVSAIKCQ